MGPQAVVCAILRRLVQKLTGFAVLLQWRHPFDHGAGYWLFSSFLLTPLTTIYFGSLYIAAVESQGSDSFQIVLSSNVVYGSIAAVTVLQMLLFLLFLRIIDQHRQSFYKERSGCEYTKAMWQITYSVMPKDEDKFDVLRVHHLYLKLIKVELTSWLHEHMPAWTENQPAWWDKVTKEEAKKFLESQDDK